ncbi:MAG: hypothetical protein HRU80_09555 [Ignavibacteriales bacterium]|nr:MAG: hypothetical protein HRU80_09555 [Ignavibacteriales bacterium]
MLKPLKAIFLLTFFNTALLSQPGGEYNSYGHHFNYLSINQFKLWISNDGNQFLAPDKNYGDRGGLFWPSGEYANKLFSGYHATMWVGNLNNNFVMPRYALRKFLKPGPVELISEKPDDTRFRIYKVRKNWEKFPFGTIRDQFELDYNEWPVEFGAPWEDRNNDGVFTRNLDLPKYYGDEQLWHVSNFADSTFFPFPDLFYGDASLKIEQHTLVYAFNRSNFLNNVAIIDLKYINKDSSPLDSCFILSAGHFLTYSRDDSINKPFCGVDTLLNLMYGYNKTNRHYLYGTPPPAGGLLVLSSKINSDASTELGLYSFTMPLVYDTNYFSFYGIKPATQYYNMSRGLFDNGSPIINPITGKKTRHLFTGYPELNEGWLAKQGIAQGIENWSIGSTFRYSLGPVTFNPSDTIHIVLAVIAAQGTDNMNSLELLRQRAKLLKRAYENNFLTPPAPASPEVKIYEEEGKVTLWWNDSAESYDIEDFMITGQNLNDTTYSFEGYRVWQFADSLGSEPREIALFDLVNGVTVIEDNIIANGLAVKAPVIIGKDNGIRRYTSVTKDIFSGGNLIPGLPYYFGVTAYSHNPFSSPSFTESPVKVYTVFPGRKKIDFSSPYSQGESLQAVQTLGSSNNAQVSFKIIDPASVKDGIYHITFSGNPKDSVYYSVTNTTTNELVLSSSADFSADTLKKSIQQGWMVLVNDPDRTQMNRLPPEQRPFGISQIYSLSPSGQRDSIVNTGAAALGGWELRSNNIQLIDLYNNIGKSDYEIRFTAQGSQYYSSGYSGGLEFLLSNDPLAKGRVPFEVWDVTRGKRLKIKIYDNITPRDTLWTQRNSTKDWERFYCFLEPDGIYAEPLASSSGVLSKSDILFGEITLRGSLPPEGTVIRIDTYKQLMEGDQFTIELKAADFSDKTTAQQKTGEISVYPNPYIASNRAEWGLGRVMRFTGLPEQAVIRIYTVAGRLVTTLRHDDLYNQYLDWNLTNEQGQRVAGGIYIAHVDMPGIGSKVLKLAVIPEKEF